MTRSHSTTIFVLLLAAPLLSGCFGYAENAVRPGDAVQVQWTATDTATGEVLVEKSMSQFIVGALASGLGASLERALVGVEVNETVFVDAPAQERSWEGTRTLDRAYAEVPLEMTADRSGFAGFGDRLAPGLEFQDNNGFPSRVTQVNDTTVRYERIVEDGETHEIPAFGLVLRIEVGQETFREILDPMVGATFTVQPNSLGVTALGLDPGVYRTSGATETQLLYQYAAHGLPILMEKDVHFEATVLQRTAGDDLSLPCEEPAVMDGDIVVEVAKDCQYGLRTSPIVLGALPMVRGATDEDHTGHAH